MGSKLQFYEFFAGGGMARAGLGSSWKCLFANDFDGKKALTYQNNWGTQGELFVGDIRNIQVGDLTGTADLAWGSFPCQDLSLAGDGAGLAGNRSGTFYPFWDVMRKLALVGRVPQIIVLENVCGTLTSHGGADFRAICKTFADEGYNFGAVVIDAVLFLPQSRPRIFFIGIRKNLDFPDYLTCSGPVAPFSTSGLRNAFEGLSAELKSSWIWWNLPKPPARASRLADILEEFPSDVTWNTDKQTNCIVEMMSETNLAKVNAAKRTGRKMVGGVYKRTRVEGNKRVVRAEVRFDDVAGCLRTPNGGSSRQTILIVHRQKLRSRLLSARETARLMGLSDKYKLPKNYNEAYHLTGDGVSVPVVRFLSENLFEPLLGRDNKAWDSGFAKLGTKAKIFGH